MHRTLWALGLRARLMGGVSLLIAGVAGALLAFLPSRMESLSRDWMRDGALSMAELLATSLEAAVEFDDAEAARRELSALASTSDAVAATVVLEKGGPLASWTRFRGVEPGAAELPWSGGVSAAEFDGHFLRVRVPVKTRADSAAPSASLVVAFSLRGLEAQRARSFGVVAATSGLVLALGLLAAFALGTLVSRPIRRMTAVALRIAEGDPRAREDLALEGGDETGRMARAFDHMLSRLYQEEERVRALNSELEGRVEARTAELAAANRELEDRLRQLHLAQEHLIVADRRASIGRLAAGVAHEINNPLAYIISNLRFATAELDTPAEAATGGPDIAEVKQGLGEALGGAERVRQIVQGLKTLARGDEDAGVELVDVGQAVHDAAKMAGNEVRHRARLVVDTAADAPRVRANPVRLGQVFLNLLINAAQAIGRGSAEENEVRAVLFAEGGWVVVEVSDTGAGIAPEHLPRLFEPFFTTKPVGVGTGLGLSICRGIVAAIGGRLSVRSRPGEGATFRVELPAAEGESESAEREESPGAPPGERLSLLVVDDDARVARGLERDLRRRHRVTLAASGEEAVERMRRGEHYDVVICDVMMPGMKGMDLLEEVKRHLPAQADRILFLTGGACTPAAEAFVATLGDRLLTKPVDVPALLRRIEAIHREARAA